MRCIFFCKITGLAELEEREVLLRDINKAFYIAPFDIHISKQIVIQLKLLNDEVISSLKCCGLKAVISSLQPNWKDLLSGISFRCSI